MSIKVEVSYDYVPMEEGNVAGWWLAVLSDNENGHSESVDFLATKPTARQIRKQIKQLKRSN
ncbi:DUF7279 family protein [Vibrio diazotrophicus]|uniref:DUF7279 family protein n=1 Tax=Vibrio diazotrophicus TaxID=685 RepID=UPI000C9EB651|nr:hypothetical protein [Vibrio diazotrophicus]PNH95118.1 hypothetical protein C1O24_16195 [Vibrio diazotrophicus]